LGSTRESLARIYASCGFIGSGGRASPRRNSRRINLGGSPKLTDSCIITFFFCYLVESVVFAPIPTDESLHIKHGGLSPLANSALQISTLVVRSTEMNLFLLLIVALFALVAAVPTSSDFRVDILASHDYRLDSKYWPPSQKDLPQPDQTRSEHFTSRSDLEEFQIDIVIEVKEQQRGQKKRLDEFGEEGMVSVRWKQKSSTYNLFGKPGCTSLTQIFHHHCFRIDRAESHSITKATIMPCCIRLHDRDEEQGL